MLASYQNNFKMITCGYTNVNRFQCYTTKLEISAI